MTGLEREVIYLGAARCFTGEGCGMVGSHPLFRLTRQAPEGYRFVLPEMLEEERRKIAIKRAAGESLTEKESAALRVLNFREKELEREMEKFSEYCKENQISDALKERFFRIIHTGKRGLQVPIWENTLSFTPSFLFCLQKTPWVVEIEDVVTLFYPFIQNGEQPGGKELKETEAYRFATYMLSKEECVGVIAHVNSTADIFRSIFPDPEIAGKVTYIPMCHAALPKKDICKSYQKSFGKKIRLFFSSSWAGPNFKVRGGFDVLAAFDRLREKFDNVELVLKCKVPDEMPEECRAIMLRHRKSIHVIEERLSEEEMTELMRGMDLFLLPSARLHVISILRAMAAGLPVVASDGWGISEYIQDGVNGSIVSGRYGKASWIDEAGMLCENYGAMETADAAFASRLADKIEQMITDEAYRFQVTRNAMQDISSKFSIRKWNESLGKAFDRHYAVIDGRKRGNQEKALKKLGGGYY